MAEAHENLGEDAGGGARERQQWVDQMTENKHVQGTTDAYAGKIWNFVDFLLANKPEALVESFRREYEQTSTKKVNRRVPRRELVTKRLARVNVASLEATGMVKLDLITEDLVLQWFATHKGKNESTPSKSVFGTGQSALVELFKRHGSALPERFYQRIKDVQKGAQRKRAQEKADGIIPLEEGKAALPGHLYLELVDLLLKSDDFVFCYTFAVCSWVLMCRVSNVANLRAAHLKWIQDSLLISLVKHKADQEGERTDPKHCYANPFNPSACVVTAIAVYFACYGAPQEARGQVFTGTRQYDRFVESIQRVLNANPSLRAKFEALGITAEDIAAHSFRKGARSFAQGGTTGGPSTPSLLVRGGWALEGMDKKYVRHEGAADQFIGRIVAMLDINSPDFAVLAPHFNAVDDEVLEAVHNCFPCPLKELESVLVMCLASLVYHSQYFEANLPKTHPLLRSAVFSQGYAAKLRGRVALSFEHDTVSATGVPPHVSIQRQMAHVTKTLTELPGKMQAVLREELEQRAADAGSITRANLEQILEGMVERMQESFAQARGAAQPADGRNQIGPEGFQSWNVEGHLRRVPHEFSFSTNIPARTLFELYCLGDQQTHICPYRKLESQDFVRRKEQKRLSDMHRLMQPVEDALRKHNLWVDAPTHAQVIEMWNEGKSAIAVPDRTPTGKARRLDQLAWTSHLNEYKKRLRDQDEDQDEDQAEDGEAA